jgi:hypothetical protein
MMTRRENESNRKVKKSWTSQTVAYAPRVRSEQALRGERESAEGGERRRERGARMPPWPRGYAAAVSYFADFITS